MPGVVGGRPQVGGILLRVGAPAWRVRRCSTPDDFAGAIENLCITLASTPLAFHQKRRPGLLVSGAGSGRGNRTPLGHGTDLLKEV